jgi:hypothetical protein
MRIGLMSLSFASLFTNTTQAQHQLQATQTQVLPQKDTQPVTENTDAVYNDQITVIGKVTDKNIREGLSGVNVTIKGTTAGTTTNIDGTFTIKVNYGDILIFSYMGMKSQEVKITTHTSRYLDIQMEEGCFLTGEVTTTQVYKSKPTFWQRVGSVFK